MQLSHLKRIGVQHTAEETQLNGKTLAMHLVKGPRFNPRHLECKALR